MKAFQVHEVFAGSVAVLTSSLLVVGHYVVILTPRANSSIYGPSSTQCTQQ